MPAPVPAPLTEPVQQCQARALHVFKLGAGRTDCATGSVVNQDDSSISKRRIDWSSALVMGTMQLRVARLLLTALHWPRLSRSPLRTQRHRQLQI